MSAAMRHQSVPGWAAAPAAELLRVQPLTWRVWQKPAFYRCSSARMQARQTQETIVRKFVLKKSWKEVTLGRSFIFLHDQFQTVQELSGDHNPDRPAREVYVH